MCIRDRRCTCGVGNLATALVAAAGVAVPLIRIGKVVNRLRHLGGQGNRATADVGISGRRGHSDSGGSQRPATIIGINIFCGGGAFCHSDFFPLAKRISLSLIHICTGKQRRRVNNQYQSARMRNRLAKLYLNADVLKLRHLVIRRKP